MARSRGPHAQDGRTTITPQAANLPTDRARTESARLKVDAVIKRIHGLGKHLELLFVVSFIEAALRLWFGLNPALYSRRLRIRRASDGARQAIGDRFALLVIYTKHSIPAFTQNLMDEINRRGLNLVISTNAVIPEGLKEKMLSQCCLLVERKDVGRDFGGYKDGIAIIQQRYGVPGRLLLLNDSLFYFGSGLESFLASFDSDDDLVAMTEVFEHHYHLGAFALSFGRRVLEHKRFQQFWRRYLPISTRRWSVQKGEVGLTRVLMQAGFEPNVLFHAARLLPHLAKLSEKEFLRAIRLLPEPDRRKLYAEYDNIREEKRGDSFGALRTISKSIGRLGQVRDTTRSNHRDIIIDRLLSLNHQTAMTQLHEERSTVESLCRDVVATISAQNQIHVGGLLFRRFLRCPAIKRDLFYRNVYKLSELESILMEFDEPLCSAIMEDVRQKGTLFHARGIRRILARHGVI